MDDFDVGQKTFKVTMVLTLRIGFYKDGDDENAAREQVQEYLAALRRVVNIPEEYEGNLFIMDSYAELSDPEVWIKEVEGEE